VTRAYTETPCNRKQHSPAPAVAFLETFSGPLYSCLEYVFQESADIDKAESGLLLFEHCVVRHLLFFWGHTHRFSIAAAGLRPCDQLR